MPGRAQGHVTCELYSGREARGEARRYSWGGGEGLPEFDPLLCGSPLRVVSV